MHPLLKPYNLFDSNGVHPLLKPHNLFYSDGVAILSGFHDIPQNLSVFQPSSTVYQITAM